jgi:non-specific serine/threonine protein kinase
LAAVAAARADPERAARLAGAASAVREMIAARPGPFDVAIPRRFIETGEKAVGATRWHRSWQAGHAMTIDGAVAYALASSQGVSRNEPKTFSLRPNVLKRDGARTSRCST